MDVIWHQYVAANTNAARGSISAKGAERFMSARIGEKLLPLMCAQGNEIYRDFEEGLLETGESGRSLGRRWQHGSITVGGAKRTNGIGSAVIDRRYRAKNS